MHGILNTKHKWTYGMIEFMWNYRMIFKMGIKLFLVFSIHVFHTQMGFTDNHMHVNVFLMSVYLHLLLDGKC